MKEIGVRGARVIWLLGYVAMVIVPRAMVWVIVPDAAQGLLAMSAITTGMVAFSLLVIAFVLMARLRSMLSSFGIESIFRMHRLVAISVVVLVVVHIGLVVASDPRGWTIFDLRDTTGAARAGIAASLALACVVALALRRKRRQPRYEGWRLLHISMAGIVFMAAWLHVWWLHHLTGHLVYAAWFALLGVAVLGVYVRRWLWLPVRSRRHSYTVEAVRPVAGDAVALEVKAQDHRGFPFRPGQFAWLKIGSSCFVFEEHPFTISSTADSPRRKQFTIKALGDFTELLRALRPGRQVYLDGPYGRMTTDGLESSWGFVFIAGGIGVTPMLSMLRTLADRADRRPHLLVLGANSVDDIVLRPEIEQLRDRLALTVVYTLQQPPDGWPGESGRIDGALLDRWLPRHGRRQFDYFLCGPPMMVSAVTLKLRDRRIPVRRLHTEQFEVV